MGISENRYLGTGLMMCVQYHTNLHGKGEVAGDGPIPFYLRLVPPCVWGGRE